MPVTTGTAGIPLDRFAAVVETDRPIPELPSRASDPVDAVIADRVAELVDDGDTVRMWT